MSATATHYSDHFSRKEMTFSESAVRLGVPNIPGPVEERELTALCEKILEPLRAELKKTHPKCFVKVNSAYRGPKANKAAGGVPTSHHILGRAADIEVPGIPNRELAQRIVDLKLPFDELILEFPKKNDPAAGWVHVSHCSDGKNAGEVFTYLRDENGKKIKKNGLHV